MMGIINLEKIMQSVFIVIIIALLWGIAVGLQGPLASLMSGQIGIMGSVFIVHLGGAVLAGALLLILGNGNLSAWRSVPWYALLAGTLGVVVISAISFTIPRVGVATTVTILVSAQLILGATLDHYGLLGAHTQPMNISRWLGMSVLLLGTWLMVK